MPTRNSIIAEALKLPEQERLEIAERLYESLDGPPDPDAEEAWAAEIERRLRSIDSGEAVLIPWEEARRRITTPRPVSPPTAFGNSRG
jgi:putative addiction module component (TIGR02574 family)